MRIFPLGITERVWAFAEGLDWLFFESRIHVTIGCYWQSFVIDFDFAFDEYGRDSTYSAIYQI